MDCRSHDERRGRWAFAMKDERRPARNAVAHFAATNDSQRQGRADRTFTLRDAQRGWQPIAPELAALFLMEFAEKGFIESVRGGFVVTPRGRRVSALVNLVCGSSS